MQIKTVQKAIIIFPHSFYLNKSFDSSIFFMINSYTERILHVYTVKTLKIRPR